MNSNHPRATLANWRISPCNRWAFENVRQLIPNALIEASAQPKSFNESHASKLDSHQFQSADGKQLGTILAESFADSLAVLHHGQKVWQWQAGHCHTHQPHIVFSVSKSITAMLVGILVEQGKLDVNRMLIEYLPGVEGSAYEDSSLRQLLDMQVAVDFNESYLDTGGDYRRYRDATGWNPVDQTNLGPSLEPFLYSLKKSSAEHGRVFDYKSPNSDLLGLLVERVSGRAFAELLSTHIWQPMGAQADAYVTVDSALLARGAGGICVSIDDLARFGQLIANNGMANDQQLIPASWIEDCKTGGSREAWQKGEFVNLLPQGCYRNQWYQVGDADQTIMALGIHGQWLYINPTADIVIAKMASQPEPVDDAFDAQTLGVFSEICQQLA